MKPLPYSLSLLTLLLIFGNGNTSAQFTRYGGGLSFSTGIEETTPYRIETGDPGVTFRGVYELNDDFYIIPGISLYIPKVAADLGSNNVKTFFGHFDGCLAYNMAHQGPIMFYGLAGADLTGLYLSYDKDTDKNTSIFSPGFTLGTGMEMIIDLNFNAFVQARYVVAKYQYLVISIGAHYYWNGRRFRTWH